MSSRPTNWARNITFSAERVHAPTSVRQLQELVVAGRRIRALGTGHSFNHIADTTGDLISLGKLPQLCELDPVRSTVTVSAGMRYGEVAVRLEEQGYALESLGSLPHISVGGAVATGTHGSGNAVGNLATAVRALEMVDADGELRRLSREIVGDELPGAVVALGALGIVTALTLRVVPTFQVRQWVYDDLPWAAVEDHVDELFAAAYSVSLFTDWRSPTVRQVWLKRRLDSSEMQEPPARWLGATLANGPRHPIADMPVENCTQQLGVPGPWHARLPHFRAEFTPSSGEELQSEYLLPREHAVRALGAVGRIRDVVGPLVQTSEIRTVAGDDLWLSPSYGRDTVAIHFTWVPDTDAVWAALEAVEEQLAPFDPRPHWGKVFTADPGTVARRYPRLQDFYNLMTRYDPAGKFRNDFLDRAFPPTPEHPAMQ
jgi:xylitol oxidase